MEKRRCDQDEVRRAQVEEWGRLTTSWPRNAGNVVKGCEEAIGESDGLGQSCRISGQSGYLRCVQGGIEDLPVVPELWIIHSISSSASA